MNSKHSSAPLQGRNNSANAEYRNDDEELSFGLEQETWPQTFSVPTTNSSDGHLFREGPKTQTDSEPRDSENFGDSSDTATGVGLVVSVARNVVTIWSQFHRHVRFVIGDEYNPYPIASVVQYKALKEDSTDQEGNVYSYTAYDLQPIDEIDSIPRKPESTRPVIKVHAFLKELVDSSFEIFVNARDDCFGWMLCPKDQFIADQVGKNASVEVVALYQNLYYIKWIVFAVKEKNNWRKFSNLPPWVQERADLAFCECKPTIASYKALQEQRKTQEQEQRKTQEHNNQSVAPENSQPSATQPKQPKPILKNKTMANVYGIVIEIDEGEDGTFALIWTKHGLSQTSANIEKGAWLNMTICPSTKPNKKFNSFKCAYPDCTNWSVVEYTKVLPPIPTRIITVPDAAFSESGTDDSGSSAEVKMILLCACVQNVDEKKFQNPYLGAVFDTENLVICSRSNNDGTSGNNDAHSYLVELSIGLHFGQVYWRIEKFHGEAAGRTDIPLKDSFHPYPNDRTKSSLKIEMAKKVARQPTKSDESSSQPQQNPEFHSERPASEASTSRTVTPSTPTSSIASEQISNSAQLLALYRPASNTSKPSVLGIVVKKTDNYAVIYSHEINKGDFALAFPKSFPNGEVLFSDEFLNCQLGTWVQFTCMRIDIDVFEQKNMTPHYYYMVVTPVEPKQLLDSINIPLSETIVGIGIGIGIIRVRVKCNFANLSTIGPPTLLTSFGRIDIDTESFDQSVLLALYDRSFEGEFWAIYSPKGRHWILKLTENDLKKLKVQLRLPSKSASTSEAEEVQLANDVFDEPPTPNSSSKDLSSKSSKQISRNFVSDKQKPTNHEGATSYAQKPILQNEPLQSHATQFLSNAMQQKQTPHHSIPTPSSLSELSSSCECLNPSFVEQSSDVDYVPDSDCENDARVEEPTEHQSKSISHVPVTQPPIPVCEDASEKYPCPASNEPTMLTQQPTNSSGAIELNFFDEAEAPPSNKSVPPVEHLPPSQQQTLQPAHKAGDGEMDGLSNDWDCGCSDEDDLGIYNSMNSDVGQDFIRDYHTFTFQTPFETAMISSDDDFTSANGDEDSDQDDVHSYRIHNKTPSPAPTF